jgi:hypothetical protein
MAEPKTIRLRSGVKLVLTDGDEEMWLDVIMPDKRQVGTCLAPDEIHQLVEALTEEPRHGD